MPAIDLAAADFDVTIDDDFGHAVTAFLRDGGDDTHEFARLNFPAAVRAAKNVAFLKICPECHGVSPPHRVRGVCADST